MRQALCRGPGRAWLAVQQQYRDAALLEGLGITAQDLADMDEGGYGG